MTGPALPDGLAEYFAARDQQRVTAVNRVLAILRPYERGLVREAAVMQETRRATAGIPVL